MRKNEKHRTRKLRNLYPKPQLYRGKPIKRHQKSIDGVESSTFIELFQSVLYDKQDWHDTPDTMDGFERALEKYRFVSDLVERGTITEDEAIKILEG